MFLPRHRVALALAAVAGVTAATVASLTLGSPAGAVAGCATTPDFIHSIPAQIAGPAAAPAGDAVLYATIGGDRKVYSTGTDISGPEFAVETLACLGGGAVDTPAVASLGGGIRGYYLLAPTGRIYERLVAAGGTDVRPWTVVPGAPVGGGAPAVTVADDGTVHLFVRGSNAKLYHSTATGPGYAWGPWENLGGGMTGVAGVGQAYNGLVVVVRAPNGTLYHRTRPVAGSWSAWLKLAGTTSASPTLAGGFSPGRLDLFVTGTTGGLYQADYSAGQRFNPLRKVDSDLPPGAKLAAAGADGRMAVYATVVEGGQSVVGVDQYLPGQGTGLGWSGFLLAPYTCDDCLPEPAAAGAHVVERTPLR